MNGITDLYKGFSLSASVLEGLPIALLAKRRIQAQFDTYGPANFAITIDHLPGCFLIIS
jgi:hypothetical protein